MSKKLIFGLALALVMVSGSYFYAQADCGCLPKISTPSCLSCGARDMDRARREIWTGQRQLARAHIPMVRAHPNRWAPLVLTNRTDNSAIAELRRDIADVVIA